MSEDCKALTIDAGAPAPDNQSSLASARRRSLLAHPIIQNLVHP